MALCQLGVKWVGGEIGGRFKKLEFRVQVLILVHSCTCAKRKGSIGWQLVVVGKGEVRNMVSPKYGNSEARLAFLASRIWNDWNDWKSPFQWALNRPWNA